MYTTSIVKHELNPDNTVLVHGTSLEATIAMLKKGKMVLEPFSKNPQKYDGYLSFIPNSFHFKEHPLYEEITGEYQTLEDMIRAAKGYAKVNGHIHCITSKLGYYPDFIDDSLADESEDFETIPLRLLEELAKKDLSLKDTLRIIKETKKRRGVVLGIGKDIFDFQIEEGSDGVSIYLPNGLDLRYITGIMPIGSVEKDTLRVKH